MNLRKLLLTKNSCYAAGVKIRPAGIMVHSTGANNPNLKRYVGPDDGLLGAGGTNHWNQPKPDGRDVCVHAFIGKLADGTVATYQTLPWDMRGWHGGGKSNDSYIGFEICEDGLTDPAYFAKVYREAAELCAYLCKTYGIRPEKPFLICHSEGYALGLASNHADVMHWFPRFGKNMDTFRADVRALMTGTGSAVPATAPAKTPEEAAADGALAAGIITDRLYWLNVLTGKTSADPKYVRLMMENAARMLKRPLPLAKTPEEAAVDAALAAGIITDRLYWLNVLAGKTVADPKYVRIMMENAAGKIRGIK